MLLLPAARDKLGLLLTLYCQAGTSQPHSSPGNSLLPQQGMGFSRQGFFLPLYAAAKQQMRVFFCLRLGRARFSLQNALRQGMESQTCISFENSCFKMDLRTAKMPCGQQSTVHGYWVALDAEDSWHVEEPAWFSQQSLQSPP